ncbi:MAG: nitrilase-related carbon-nitrogen hydrolase, partial [Lutibacter sp.]
SGKLDYYNKRHLFSLAGEDKIYTAGAQKVIINYKNWKICPQVCYDLRFPVFSRNIENYDLLIYVANWPVPRIKAWDNLLKARAIENMSYVLGVNRIGEDANHLQYNGHSVALNYLGENIVNGYSEENIFEANLSKESMNEARKKLNFLSDKDNFKLL